MSRPSPPTGYDVCKRVQAGRSDCLITVGFDRIRSHIPRFLIQLHYQTTASPVQWDPIARMDHNDSPMKGHNVYKEGLHVDIDRRTSPEVKLYLHHSLLPASRGTVIRRCVEYFDNESDYFVDVFEERTVPGTPPRWPDGGTQAPKFIRDENVEGGMSKESSAEEPLSLAELSETLAAAEDTTAEKIEQGAEDIDIATPEKAEVTTTDDQDE